ncbi:response regulator transcription factor, partial [Micromonospora sp. NPDC049799]|uniref:response regulator transcription factor n=1 Tax=Micromonospora sp. NPDC049799 TaxID=3154741 RepID=UPI00340DD246
GTARSTPPGRSPAESTTWPAGTADGTGAAPAMVPAQRGDDPGDPAAEPEQATAGGTRNGVTGRNGRSSVGLTERELQVLLGMAEGKSNAEIGRELFVSEDTVKTHARRLFRKLGARDRAHAVAAGFRAGLVA